MKRITIAITMIAVGVAIGLLVFGVGTFGNGEKTRGNTDNSYMDTATYVGSDTCKGCHPSKHTDWSETLHSKMVQEPTPANVTGDWTVGTITLNDTANSIDDVSIGLSYDGSFYNVTMNGNTYTVNYTLGSSWMQRYLTQIGGSLYVLPVQWNTATTEWVAYYLNDWYDPPTTAKSPATDESWNRRCAGCHTTGLEITYEAGPNEWTGTWSEFNVACEACHGPGSEHVAQTDKKAYIWKDNDPQICGQCHNRGESADQLGGENLEYPYNTADGRYMPGDNLDDFFTSTPGVHGDGMTSSQHRQQYIDWSISGHNHIASSYAQNENCMSCRSVEGFIAAVEGTTPSTDVGNMTWMTTCTSCHDPHEVTGNDHQLRVEEDELCPTCHTLGADPTLDHLPKHNQNEAIVGVIEVIPSLNGSPWMNGDVSCVDCHMPKVATSAVNYDISSHSLHFLTPENSLMYGMPNSCTVACHDGVNGFVLPDAQANSTVHGWHDDISSAFASAESNLTAAEAAINNAPGWGFNNATITTALDDYQHGMYAWTFVESDASMTHNPSFQGDLLTYANDKANAILDALVTGTVQGTIVDPDGEGVSGATISLGNVTLGTTGSDGTFGFELAPGTHTLTVTLGDDTTTIDVTVAADQVSDTGETQLGEKGAADNMMLYLLIIAIIIIVVIIIAVVAMKRRGGPVVEEDVGPEPEPEPEPELEE